MHTRLYLYRRIERYRTYVYYFDVLAQCDVPDDDQSSRTSGLSRGGGERRENGRTAGDESTGMAWSLRTRRSEFRRERRRHDGRRVRFHRSREPGLRPRSYFVAFVFEDWSSRIYITTPEEWDQSDRGSPLRYGTYAPDGTSSTSGLSAISGSWSGRQTTFSRPMLRRVTCPSSSICVRSRLVADFERPVSSQTVPW